MKQKVEGEVSVLQGVDDISSCAEVYRSRELFNIPNWTNKSCLDWHAMFM